ncbi:hypothetical protein [Dactylosporangium darangshiense]
MGEIADWAVCSGIAAMKVGGGHTIEHCAGRWSGRGVDQRTVDQPWWWA